jgi:hypothetical protein
MKVGFFGQRRCAPQPSDTRAAYALPESGLNQPALILGAAQFPSHCMIPFRQTKKLMVAGRTDVIRSAPRKRNVPTDAERPPKAETSIACKIARVNA